MSAKSFLALILLAGVVCFGLPESPYDHFECGPDTAEAQEGNSVAQGLIQELEKAIQSGDIERVRAARQRVNAHRQAARILAGRPVLQLQLKMAMAPAAALKKQAIQSQGKQKQQLTTQARALQSAGGLSSASSPKGTSDGIKTASQLSSGQFREISNTGVRTLDSRMAGVSAATRAGMGAASTATGTQGFSSKPTGVSKDIGTGVATLSVKGVAVETARGLGSKEQMAGLVRDSEGGLSATAVLAAGAAASVASEPPASRATTSRSTTRDASQPVPTPPVSVRHLQAPVVAAPVSVPGPAKQGVISKTPAEFKPPAAAVRSLPALEQVVQSSGPPEAPRMSSAPEIIGRGPGGTGVIVPPKVREGTSTAAGPPISGSLSPEAPRPSASPEIISRGPGGTGVIVPARVRDGSVTSAGPSAPGSDGSAVSGPGGSPFYNQPLPEPIKVNPPTPGGGSGGTTTGGPNIHDLVQQIRPTPPDPRQVKEWSDSIRRPAPDPPKQIEKFSGGDPRWTEINQRVTQASEPLFPNRSIPAKDPELARLANREQNYTRASEDPGLARLAGKEPRPPTYTERVEAYQQASQRAAETNEGLVEALRSGNQQQIDRAALQQRADPLAVKQANIRELPEIKTRMNEPMANIQHNMEPGIKNQIARQYGVSPDEVTVHYTSNPSRDPKVHQDADVTVRVRGMDVPADKARPIVNEQFQRAAAEATGGKAGAGMSPDKFAESHYIESTDRLHRHAYGSSAAEGQQILHGPKNQPIRDVNQVAGAMADKYNVARNEAIDLTRQGRLPEAEVRRGLAMGQTVKQFDDLVQPRVEPAGGRVPAHVQKGVDILRDVREGPTSPVQAEAALRQMGETPDSITQKATGLVESAQKLQGPGKGVVPDRVGNETFVQNVKDRMGLNRLAREAGGGGKGPGGGPSSASPTDTGAFRPVSGQTPLTEGRSSFQEPSLTDRVAGAGRNAVEGIQKTDQALGRALGLGELSPDASALRSGLNTAAGAALTGAAVVGSAAQGYGIGHGVGSGIKDYQKAGELRERAQAERAAGREQAAQILETQADRFASQGREKLTDAGEGAAWFGGGLAAGALAPTAMGVAGAGAAGVATYTGTRALLEGTETGRKVDKGVEDFMDRGMQAGEALTDQLGRMAGGQSKEERDRAEMTGRQAAYDRALDRGAITLRDGVTREDLMDYLKNRNPAPSDKDGYTTEDYRAGLNELISRTPPGQKPTSSPATAEPQAGGTPTPGTEPVKTRQEQDLEDYNRLQAIRNLQGGNPPPAEAAAQDKPPEEAVLPPVAPPLEVDPQEPDSGNRDFGADYIASEIVDKFGGIQDAQQRQQAIAGYLRDLRDAERATGSGASPQPDKAGGGFDPNLQIALSANVTGSALQNQGQEQQQDSQQAWGTVGGAQAERAAAAQNQQMQDQSRVQAQGQQANQAISANAQEFSTAQQTLQVTRQNSLGNILLDSGMGGLTSGTAVGIDAFATPFSQAAGQQFAANMGLQTQHPHHEGHAGGTTASAGAGATGGSGTQATSAASAGSGSASGTSPATAAAAPGAANKPPQNTAMTYAGTFNGVATATAGFGKRGKVQCSYTAQFKVTLHPNGSATAVQNGGYYVTFDEHGNGKSCSPGSSQWSYTGTHGNGRVTIRASGRTYTGQYTDATLTASGGGSGQMTLSNGKPVTDRVAGSMNLSRQ